MSVYDDEILRLAKSGVGVLADGDGLAGDGGLTKPPGVLFATESNPLCGDECTVYAQLADGKILQTAHATRGCILTEASAAKFVLLSRQFPQASALRDLAAAFQNNLQNGAPPPAALQVFTPVLPRKSRHICVLLPFLAFLKLTSRV